MERNKKIALIATLVTFVLLALILLDVVPSAYGLPVVLAFLGATNINNGIEYKKAGRKIQGNLTIIVGALVVIAFVYYIIMLFV